MYVQVDMWDLRWSDGFALHSAFVGAGIRCQTLGRCRLLCWVAAAVAGMKGNGFCHLCPQWNLALQLVTPSSRWLKNHKTSQNLYFSVTLWWTYKKLLKMAIEIVDFPINSMVIFHSFLYVHQRLPDHLWPSLTSAFRGWGTHLDLFCGSCEDKPRNIFVHESHPLPRPQPHWDGSCAVGGAWDGSNVSPKPNKTVEHIPNDGTICNYDFWNCFYAFECFYDSSKFSKSWFYHIISSRHKPIKKHLEVLQVPFCHYRTVVLWQLSQVVSPSFHISLE